MERNAVVSISLLTAGKKKELEKCLVSLKPLMQAVPAELIIVDTGCDKDSRAVIERYATQIVDFTWCDDFAKARNAGLEKASGEWFLYLDDDEWFEDMTEIIAFFQTGEYRNYQYAMYLVRNYEDTEGKYYSDTPVGRMIALKPDTHFIYAIHECFADVGSNTKYFSAYVHHYGYAYQSEEERIQHAKRNLPLLWTEHEREPGNLRHTLQLMQEYRSLQEYDKVVELGCAEIFRYDSDENEQIYYFNSLLVLTLLALVSQEKMQELTRMGEQLQNHPYIGKLAEAYVCALLAYGYREMGKYREAVQTTANYVKLWEEYRKDESCFLPFETGILAPCFQGKTIHAALENGIMAAVAITDFKSMLDWSVLLCREEGTFHVSEKCRAMILTGMPEEFLQKLGKECRITNRREWLMTIDRILCQPDDLAITEIDRLLGHYMEIRMEEGSPDPLISLIKLLKEARRTKNAGRLVAVLKQILELRGEWAKAIRICMEEALDLLNTAKNPEQTELLQLAIQVKERVRLLISRGEMQEASIILRQLLPLVPEDEEVRQWMEWIGDDR